MTVQNQPNKFTLNGDGTNKVFPFTNLRLIDVEDLDVYIIDSLGNQTLQVVGVDYTLTYNEDTQAGDVTFVTAPLATDEVFGIRVTPIEQGEVIPVESDFDAKKIEGMVDNTVCIVQDQQDELNRTVKAPATYTGNPLTIEPVAENEVIVGNATGDGFVGSGVDASDLTGAIDQAAASATAAAGSASAASVSEGNAAASESNAAASAAAALTSETNAATSEVNASTSESNAAASAAAAEVAKIEWQGTWGVGTTYALNDAVEYNGTSYISIQAGTGQQPDISPAYWDVLAQKGAGAEALNDLTDVSLTSPVVDEILQYDGAEWVNAPLSGVPVGAMIMLPRNNIPTGYLECNGAAFSAGTYPELSTYLGGTTLPDMRGEFPRGWDNGRGVDSGRSVGTFQNHQFGRHNHSNSRAQNSNVGNGGPNLTTADGSNGSAASTGFAGGTSNSNETRPRNIALIFAIKAE